MPKSKHRKNQKRKSAHNRRQIKQQRFSSDLKQKKQIERLEKEFQQRYEEEIQEILDERAEQRQAEQQAKSAELETIASSEEAIVPLVSEDENTIGKPKIIKGGAKT
ncbi:hypothetical protein BPT24_047 [Tenacibaculum phage pT24]|uniref:Uncharacterized protein n=1 Tax=Tenacibaculum phage pT24 TaxID=1880590 RepID=A0A1B4XWI2_9CAUD|nr:hypothetical protein HYP10_gp047 [Tenacibaculum phage pT24]BAV39170.1 hypothetical protein BPT24_047 [Tenacibaculum phage pT24]